MKIFLFLAALLVASLPSGEALKCRVCQSKDKNDDCTNNPLFIGAVNCGKYENDLKKTLDSVIALANENITDEKAYEMYMDLKAAASHVEQMIGNLDKFYTPTANHSVRINKTIVEYKDAYQTYHKRGKRIKFVNQTIEAIETVISKMENDTGKLKEFIDAMGDTETKVKAAQIPINTVFNRMKDWRTANYSGLKTKVDVAVTSMESGKTSLNAIIQKIKEVNETLSPIVADCQSDMAADLKDALNGISETNINDLKNSITEIQSRLSNAVNTETTQKTAMLAVKTPLDAFVQQLTTLKNRIDVLDNPSDKIEEDFRYFNARKTALTKSLKDAMNVTTNDLSNLKEKANQLAATIVAVMNVALESKPTKKWMCFKEHKVNSSEVNRGCTDDSAPTNDEKKFYVCDNDGCNSSSNIGVGFITIFATISVALGLTR